MSILYYMGFVVMFFIPLNIVITITNSFFVDQTDKHEITHTQKKGWVCR